MAIDYTSTQTTMPGETRERMEQERRAIVRRLDDARNAVTEKTREAARYANQQVHSNPWQSVGVAFAAGAMFGLLVGISLHR